MTEKDFQLAGDIVKVDTDLGLIFGWAIICEVDGEPYFDKQGDHIPPATMVEASAEFMQNSRVGAEMHARDAAGNVVKGGSVVFCWPMTADIAKAMQIDTKRTGLLVAIKPDDESALVKARSGEYRGFSIGGSRITDEQVTE